MMIVMQRKIRGAILIGIVGTAIVGILFGLGHAPRGVIAMPYSLAPIALHLDIAGVLRISFLPILLTLFLMSFLDTLGTLVGVGAAGGVCGHEGNFRGDRGPDGGGATSCGATGHLRNSPRGASLRGAVRNPAGA